MSSNALYFKKIKQEDKVYAALKQFRGHEVWLHGSCVLQVQQSSPPDVLHDGIFEPMLGIMQLVGFPLYLLVLSFMSKARD